MSKHMLDPIVRALCGMPYSRLGVILDAANKIGGTDGERWHSRFAEVLREGLKSPADHIHLDRSTRPAYPDFVDPDWLKQEWFRELEATGPSDYSLDSLDHWLHDNQENDGVIGGRALHRYLKEQNLLPSCLGLADLLAIQALGIDVFRRYFQGKAVFGWKSVVPHRNGRLHVPYLIEHDNQVRVSWYWLKNDWYGCDPALRFAK